MQITDIQSFIDYYRNVRARTRRLILLVPPEQLEWTYQAGRFTLGDLIRHIAAIERLLYVETAFGRPNRYVGCGREIAQGYEATVAYFDRSHAETLVCLQELTTTQLQEKCHPLNGPGITVWKWLRLLAEHEIHHRGQLYMYLGMLGIKTPPIFGLTSEEVAAFGKRVGAESRKE